MAYTMTAGGQRFRFDCLKDVLAAASPARSGDALAGVAAQSDVQRFAAKMCLADLPLSIFLNEAVIPYENDEITRLIIDSHDADAFRPIASLTVGDFRNWLLSEEATTSALKAIAPAVTPEMAAAVSKLMRNQDLILAAKKCNTPTAFRNTLGLPGRMAVRLQPNHPTDDLKGILASTIDGLLYGCGDAVIGINPASDNPAVLSGILRMLDELIERFSIPTQTCVLTHVTSSIEMINAGAPVDLIFQSVAGSQKANSSFGIDLKVLQEGLDAGRSLNRGTVGNNCMYFETGQGSALSADAHFGVDQQTMEARAYAVCRQFEPLLVNTVVGFIGPEYLYNGKQIIRAGLEDHFCGKLMGLPIGADICYTNHADADQDDMDTLLTLLATAGVNFVIGVPGADDIMLNYQSTSFHDQLYVRELLGLKRAPEFESWLQSSGISDADGRLLPQSASNNALMSLAEDTMMGAAA
ncbi:ethanolamine ammonia-lyase subunit EutB [Rhizobium tumorigenes]|uniref:ethanolamine ammonia-lyase subunit EutB n=1 Tax=Rhizobium tumorigenes TaxID=2041385 RepID=UPI00241FB5B6|nr:ethanolamine ammonia-lyase subunit EutB [Rhizobium tumorigenes]WFS00744.1 ethanolamine ammonia-lyase subunit EutB [Rhizobium tumorigenes]